MQFYSLYIHHILIHHIIYSNKILMNIYEFFDTGIIMRMNDRSTPRKRNFCTS